MHRLLPARCMRHFCRRSRAVFRARYSTADCLTYDFKLELENALESSKFQPASAKLVQRMWRHSASKSVACQPSSDVAGQDRRFVLMLPPPNVTGVLHMGHALAFVLQDALVRWHRLRGYRTLWMPGFDHAGIATQVLMEQKLRRELGLNRRQVGREKFVAEAGKWADEKRAEIKCQMDLLGLSVDWSEEYFTYDEKHSEAVTEAFVRLFDQGLIYRSEQLVNWSCALESAISDIEVETREIPGPTRLRVPGHPQPVEFGRLHLFEYPLLAEGSGGSGGGGGGGITVATTRPETMLGDTAVAVHPSDGRYAALVGRLLRHPLCPGRELPVVAHESVDPQFGTGAVKLTPGHSRADFAVMVETAAAKAAGTINVFTEAGAVSAECGAPAEMVGSPRFVAREAVIGRLAELGLYRGSREHAMTLPMCSRSGDVVEHMLKSQWFARCSGRLAERAADAVRSGRLRIQPAGFAAEWLEWMRRTGDWCLSRQIWWGHRIPAYEVTSPDGRSLGWVAARSEAEASARAARRFGADFSQLRRDPDVLDTWFSSGLLPLSLAGWPGRPVPDPARLPQSLLETGHDILFFWAARMAMLTDQLVGQLPFHSVLLNGLVCDSQGRKMSKSQGNVLDPIGLIGRGGPDALRLALCSHRFQLERVAFDQQLVDSCARLVNKLWQSHRYLRPRLRDAGLLGRSDPGQLLGEIEASAGQLDKVDAWLMSRLAALVDDCERSFTPDSYQLQEAANRLREFWSADFCDVGLECLKSPATGSASLLVACLTSLVYLRLLQPFCPHACELLLIGAHGGGGGGDLPCPPAADLQQWRNPGLEEVAGFVRDLLARSLDWRALLRPADSGACFLLYNSAKCPVDATLFTRMISQLGRMQLRAESDLSPTETEPLLRLELCAGLHFALPKSSARLPEAVRELESRRRKQVERRDQLARSVEVGGDDSSSGERMSQTQRKKLDSLMEQIDSLSDRLRQLELLVSGS